MDTTRIDMDLYLKALSQIEQPADADMTHTLSAFRELLALRYPEYLEITTGEKEGDGVIVLTVKSHAATVQSSSYTLTDSGKFMKVGTGTTASVPPAIARLFIASMFGVDELSEQPSPDDGLHAMTMGVTTMYDQLLRRQAQHHLYDSCTLLKGGIPPPSILKRLNLYRCLPIPQELQELYDTASMYR